MFFHFFPLVQKLFIVHLGFHSALTVNVLIVHICSPLLHSSTFSLLTCIAEKNLVEITDYLLIMEKRHIYHLGLVLGLTQNKVKEMMNSETFLDDVIAAWLRKEDYVTEKGEPSWTVLISALKHPRVSQTGIANAIAKDKRLQQ